MPISNAVQKLGPKWLDVIDKAREAELPDDGLTIQAFGVRFLDVPPNTFDEVAHALARKGVVWIGSDRGVRKVYRKKPEGISWRADADPVADALAEATKHAVAWARSGRAESATSNEADRSERMERKQAAIERIVKGFAKATANGLPVSLLRTELARVFCADLVAALCEAAPALAVGSDSEILASEVALPRLKLLGSESVAERVGLEIERRGKAGAGKSDLLSSIRPYVGAEDLAKALAELEDGGLVESVRMLAPGAYRKALRWFMPGMLPDLDGHGRPLERF